MTDAKAPAANTLSKTITPTPDPSGEVSNTPFGAGTQQREPKPEDYPASAKVAPPAEQVYGSKASGVVGELVKTSSDTSATADAVKEGIEKHAEAQDKIADATTKVVEAKRDLDDSLV